MSQASISTLAASSVQADCPAPHQPDHEFKFPKHSFGMFSDPFSTLQQIQITTDTEGRLTVSLPSVSVVTCICNYLTSFIP